MSLNRIANFLALASIKIFARIFYTVENTWVSNYTEDPWSNIKMIAVLNHTSLFEPVVLGAAPFRILWRIAGRIIAPGADVTLDRPVVGRFLKYVAPKMMPISRERDETWDNFLAAIEPESVVVIAPEGRMKRPDGLDKHGKPMSVRGGVADILEVLPDGEMVLVYSGGLHHIQAPGQGFPKLFKRVVLQTERLNIQDYVRQMKAQSNLSFKKAVIADLESRMKKHVPSID